MEGERDKKKRKKRVAKTGESNGRVTYSRQQND
jgi:hypothetical protein